MKIVVMMLMAVLARCASGNAQEDIRSTSERLNCEYTRMYNAGQLDKILDFFAEDAMTLSPDQRSAAPLPRRGFLAGTAPRPGAYLHPQ